jgi:hypothetical protein
MTILFFRMRQLELEMKRIELDETRRPEFFKDLRVEIVRASRDEDAD